MSTQTNPTCFVCGESLKRSAVSIVCWLTKTDWEVFQERCCMLKKTVSRSLGEGKERFKKRLIQTRWSYQNTDIWTGSLAGAVSSSAGPSRPYVVFCLDGANSVCLQMTDFVQREPGFLSVQTLESSLSWSFNTLGRAIGILMWRLAFHKPPCGGAARLAAALFWAAERMQCNQLNKRKLFFFCSE